MNHIDELERASEIADARLGVAEELRWHLAFSFSLVVYLVWHSWLLAGAAYVVIFYIVSWPYRRSSNEAEDQYLKAAGLGKYSPLWQHKDSPPE